MRTSYGLVLRSPDLVQSRLRACVGQWQNHHPLPTLASRPSQRKRNHTTAALPFQCRRAITTRSCVGYRGSGRDVSSTPLMGRNARSFSASPETTSMEENRAFVAFGSNLGDRVAMVEQACQRMEERGIKIKRTSSLFETAPMYVTDQGTFINGVCEVATTLGPFELLDTLQSIELELGRVKYIDKGPRNIDLDILLYNDAKISHERLNIPHSLMLEREFVLRPLCQLIPHEKPNLPESMKTPSISNNPRSYLSYLNALPISSNPPHVITPLSASLSPLAPWDPKRKTHVMAVLNLTPNSFSDGGLHASNDLGTTVRKFISAGATIIDIGGESTRPDVDPVTEEEELARVVPAIEYIRSLPEAENIAISIDTYKARVAEAAVNAGADIINDISAGLLDPNMLPTMARLQKTVILMHTRGTPKTMTGLTDYPDGVIAGVNHELSERVKAAEKAGVRRWRIIGDPGIGFAKNQDQNSTLLRDLARLRNGDANDACDDTSLRYLPWLVGTSRKKFIGRITAVDNARDRTWGTAAAITAAIAGGADIVRVHDIDEMAKVTRMADAIYRQR